MSSLCSLYNKSSLGECLSSSSIAVPPTPSPVHTEHVSAKICTTEGLNTPLTWATRARCQRLCMWQLFWQLLVREWPGVHLPTSRASLQHPWESALGLAGTRENRRGCFKSWKWSSNYLETSRPTENKWWLSPNKRSPLQASNLQDP